MNSVGAVIQTIWSDTVTVNNSSAALPGAFAKTSPTSGLTGQSTSPTLSWGASSGVTAYEYCYDTTNDNACTNWVSNGTGVSKTLSGLSLNTTYYWQVRAVNGAGTTYANGNATAFWSFTTVAKDVYETDNTFEQAKTITSGQVQTHNINPATDVDWVKFVITSPSAVSIETNGSTGADTRLWLYDSNQTELQFDDNSGNGNYSLVNRACGTEALAAGTYYVKVDENGQNSTIPEYSLSFTVTQSCATVPYPPSDLKIKSTTQNSITISWMDNSNNETGFKVYRWGVVGGVWDFYYFATVAANATTFTQANLVCDNNFNYYKISAFNEAGETALVGFVQGTTAKCAVSCYTLTTGVNPATKGTVTAAPLPNCEAGMYEIGTQVTLTAQAVSGFSFTPGVVMFQVPPIKLPW